MEKGNGESTDNELDESKKGCFGRFKIKTQRLIDGHFYSGCPGSAAQNKDNGKTGKIEKENDARTAGQDPSQYRPLDQFEE